MRALERLTVNCRSGVTVGGGGFDCLKVAKAMEWIIGVRFIAVQIGSESIANDKI